MKKLLSVVIIGIVVLGGLGAIATGAYQPVKKSYTNNAVGTTYVDELDQSMTDYDGSLPLGRTNIFGFYANLSVTQSFIPQKELLTRAQFLMARNATTSSPCVLAVRDNLTGENLAIVSVTPGEFPVVNGTPTEEDQLAWIDFNFDDIWVTPGQTYYLVVYTANITGNYYWISGNGTNMYPNGSVMISIDDGKTWRSDVFPDADGCFKTYGLRETFLNITMKGSFLGPSFVIKNIGNYTAWDVEVNLTVKGGILGLIDHQVVGGTQELLPGAVLNVTNGFIFGFGQVTISIKVLAANVHEISTEKNAMVIFFFMFIK
jgi:hypothetical protein